MAKAQKGSSFEREFAKKLSLWWTNGEDDFIFWRTSQSGGRATTRAKSGRKANLHCGDIGAVDPRGEPLLKWFSFELKRGYGRSTIQDLLDTTVDAKQSKYEEWIVKADRDRDRAGAMFWALIHRRDRKEPLLFLPYSFNKYIAPDDLYKIRFFIPKLNTYIFIYKLDEFLAKYKPEYFNTLLESKK